MIRWSHPELLLLALPWALGLGLLLRRQRRALAWLGEQVSSRALARLTRHDHRSLGRTVLGLGIAGCLLLLAAAGPFTPDDAEREESARILVLVFDASLSMGAGDITERDAEAPAVSRFGQARQLALALVEARPDDAFAVVSFSGDSVIHLPPTIDRPSLRTLLSTLQIHAYSESMGSRFSSAFAAVLRLMAGTPGAYQVILLSDGELPEPDAYETDLRPLEAAGIPVHTVGFGRSAPWGMSVYVLEDVLSGAEEKRIAGEYRTRREDRELRRIAERTGGRLLVVEEGSWLAELGGAIDEHPAGTAPMAGLGRQDRSPLPLLLFLLLLSFDRLRAPRRPPTRIGVLLLLGFLPLLAGCGLAPAPIRAHLANERGRERMGTGADAAAAAEAAIPWFRKAASFGYRAHIPIANEGSAHLVRGDPARAHEAFTAAIELSPRFGAAWYDDGHALERWGAEELDLERCELERTRTLWIQARDRFRRAAVLDPTIAPRALLDSTTLDGRLFELDRREESCAPPPESGGGGGGPPPPPDAPPEPPPPPSAGEPPPEDGPESDGPGDPPPEGGTGGGPGSGEPPPLSPEERRELASALERVHEEAASGSFRHTRFGRITPEGAEQAVGRPIRW